MGRTRIAKAVARDLVAKREVSQKRKYELEKYLSNLKGSYESGKISYSRYVEIFHKKNEGKNISEWIQYYDRYGKQCEKEEEKHNRKIIKNKVLKTFFSVALISALVYFFFFTNYVNLSFTGLAIEGNQKEFVQELNLNLTNSTEYEWRLENLGQLSSIKLSGLIEGEGNVKIYLDNLLILDSSNIKESNKKSSSLGITGGAIDERTISDSETSETTMDTQTIPEEPIITDITSVGTTLETSQEIQTPAPEIQNSEIEALETPATETTNLETTEPSAQDSNNSYSEQEAPSQEESSPSQEELLTENNSSNSEEQKEVQIDLNKSSNETGTIQEEANETREESPSQIIGPLPPSENETANQTEINETKNKTETINKTEIEITIKKFKELCEDTCDLEDLNLNQSSYTLRIEVSNAILQLDTITYELLPEGIVPVELNETNISEENITINTIQYSAVLGQPVKWKKEITLDKAGSATIEIPKEAGNVIINKISDTSYSEKEAPSQEESSPSQGELLTENKEKANATIETKIKDKEEQPKNSEFSMTGKVISDESKEEIIEVLIEDNSTQYEIEYETPAPYAIEEETSKGKKVEIVGPETIHYENVLIFTNLNENLNIKSPSSVKIYWIENNTYLSPTKIEDKNGNGIYDYVEFIAPHLSNQTFEIIIITKALHLNSDRELLSEIYEQVKEQDNIWSETIPDGDYVRVTFEVPLDNTKDITIYSRITNGTPIIEVYEKDSSTKIAEFSSLNSNEYNKIFLTNLIGEQDTFDLRIVNGSVKFDYIVDPIISIFSDNFEGGNLNLWTDGGGTLWDLATDQKYAGSYSLKGYYNNAGDIFTDNIDMSNATFINVSFWFRDDDLDNTDIDFYFFDGSNYDRVDTGKLIGTYGTEDTWQWINYTTSDSQYFKSNFRVRFNAVVGSAENLWIDNFLVQKTTDNTPPTFTTIPSNSSLWYGNQSLNVTFAGTDETGFGYYSINDTTRFSMNNPGGFLTNATPLAYGNYNVNVTINDTFNNINWTIYAVQINRNSEKCQVLFNETSPLDYPKHFYVWTNCTSTFVLSRNGTTITNNSEQSLEGGAYNFSMLRNDISNYSCIYNESEFIINQVEDNTPPQITINFPNETEYDIHYDLPFNFNISLNEQGSAMYSLDNETENVIGNTTMYNSEGGIIGTEFNSTLETLPEGNYTFRIYANDTLGNNNYTETVNFTLVQKSMLVNATILDAENNTLNTTIIITNELNQEEIYNETGTSNEILVLLNTTYTIDIIPNDITLIDNITFESVNFSEEEENEEFEIELMDINEGENYEDFPKLFMLNNKANKTATVHFTAQSNTLYKCTDYNFGEKICLGEWDLFMENLVVGNGYSFEIAPGDPGYGIINITNAEHLNSTRDFISDIFNQVKTLDDVWSETIPNGDYVRVTFETSLENSNDITLWPRTISGNPSIEVYEVNESTLIANFTTIADNEYNQVLLTELIGSQNTFDLHIIGGSVEFDHIVDPSTVTLINADASSTATGVTGGTHDGGHNVVRVNNGNLIAAWEDASNDASCSYSTNNGTAWQTYSSEAGTHGDVALATNGTAMVYIFTNELGSAYDQQYIFRNVAGVCDIATGAMANVSTAITGDNIRPDVAYDGNHDRYVTCSQDDDDWDIDFAYASAVGTTLSWTGVAEISGAATSDSCSIDVNDNGNVFIASDDSGASSIIVYNSSAGTFATTTAVTAYNAPVTNMHMSIRGIEILITAIDANSDLVVVHSSDGRTYTNDTYTGTFSDAEGCVDGNGYYHIIVVNGTLLSYIRYTGSFFNKYENFANANTERYPSVLCSNFPSNNRLMYDRLDFVFTDTGTNIYFANITIDTNADAISPTYTQNSTSNTDAGLSTNFSINVTDNLALNPNGMYVFESNNTGASMTNDTPVNFTTTPSWANVTKTLNSTAGKVIGYRWYFNDSFGNVNSTPIYVLTTTTFAQDCGTLSTEGQNVILTENVTSTGTCFTVAAENITIDCADYWINYSTDGATGTYGIYTNQFNTTIKNCNIVDGNRASAQTTRYGIYFDGNDNSTLYNNYVNTSNSNTIQITGDSDFNNLTDNEGVTSSGAGIYLIAGYNTLVNNTFNSNSGNAIDLGTGSYNHTLINTSGISGSAYGIMIYGSSNNTLTNCTAISTTGAGLAVYQSNSNTLTTPTIKVYDSSWAIEISTNSNNLVFRDCLNLSGGDPFIYQDSSNSSFINCTYPLNKETVEASTLIRKWYYQAYVNYSNGAAASDVNITSYNSTNSLEFTDLTNSSGWIQKQEVTEYINRAGTITYFSNYTIFANKSETANGTNVFNFTITQNKVDDWFTLVGEGADLTSPTYTSISHNSTLAGEISLFAININDNSALHPNGQYLFSTNNTGAWINDTAINFTTTPSWANVTKILNSTGGTIVGYRWYFNDTAGNRNSTEIYTLTTESPDITPPNITINSPTGTIADVTPLINISSNESSTIWYNIDNGDNITLCESCTSSQNKFLYLEEGNYTIYVFVNDSSGNNGTSSNSFTIDMNNNYYENFDDNSSIYANNEITWYTGNITFSGGFNYLNDANLISLYNFDNAGDLGNDSKEANDFATLESDPAQSATVPSGFTGYSLELDGNDGLCDADASTFQKTGNHTLCWWSYPAALNAEMNQFAQNCAYDTWTTGTTGTYQWRINNCGATPQDLNILGALHTGEWTQFCQTYDSTNINRTVYINGVFNASIGTVSIEDQGNAWCIGTYGGGGYFVGNIYKPMWFSRVLSANEILSISSGNTGVANGNFTSYAINTTENITSITNVTWTELNTDANNNITVQVSADGGNNWYTATSGSALGQTFTGENNSIVYRVIFSGSNIIGLSDMNISWGAGTANNPPEIILVYNSTEMTDISNGPNEGPLATSVQLNFTAYDAQGFGNLNDSSVQVNFSLAGEESRLNTSCSLLEDYDTNYANYTCNVTMWWWDAPGNWTINASIKDNDGNEAFNDSTNFLVGSTTGFLANATQLNWPEINPGATNQEANEFILLNNTGNEEASVEVNATDLIGENNPSYALGANNFSINISSGCEGTQMSRYNYVTIIGATIPKGNYSLDDGTAQETIYFCLETSNSNLISQPYSTGQEGSWTIRVFLAAFAIRRRKKGKKIQDDKLLKAINLIADELREEYSLNKKEVIEIIIERLKKKYDLTRNEFLGIIKAREGITIPITIFTKELGALESLTKYMKENINMNYREIAKELGRNERTIWTAYKKANEKQKEPIKIKETEINLPISIFENKKLTILEAIVIYLKEKGKKYSEIGILLNRDQRNIWTIYSRTIKKLKT